MIRPSIARISGGGVTIPLILALLLMAGGLLASEHALNRAAAMQLRFDAEQSRTAVEQILSARGASVVPTSSLDFPRLIAELRPVLLDAPTERSAAALVAGTDTVLVIGDRSALQHDPHVATRLRVRADVPWMLVVAHVESVETLRNVLWLLILTSLGILGIGLVRERRQALRVLERSAELERLYSEVASANTAKSEFLANISHELRTPLNAIVGFVELLKDGVYGDLSSRQVPPVDRIAASAVHLRHLVDQVLDIAKIAAGRLEVHPESLVLRPFVLNVASELESLFNERGLSISIAIGASLPRIRSDPAHLRQILVNLIGNAVKYTPSGSVVVRARLVEAVDSIEAEAPSARHLGMTPSLRSSVPPDQRSTWIALQVVDTGVGIDPADQARIFQEFEQVNAGQRGESMQRGTGLGLAISRRLAHLLGGDIGLESQVGAGSTFTLWLPVHLEDFKSATSLTEASAATIH